MNGSESHYTHHRGASVPVMASVLLALSAASRADRGGSGGFLLRTRAAACCGRRPALPCGWNGRRSHPSTGRIGDFRGSASSQGFEHRPNLPQWFEGQKAGTSSLGCQFTSNTPIGNALQGHRSGPQLPRGPGRLFTIVDRLAAMAFPLAVRRPKNVIFRLESRAQRPTDERRRRRHPRDFRKVPNSHWLLQGQRQ